MKSILVGTATELVEHHRDRVRVHVVVPVEAAKRIERAIYVVDKIIRNLDWVALINSIFGHGYCPQYGQQPGVFRLATCTTAHFRSRSSTASTLVTLPSFYCGERDRHCCQWAGPRRIFVRAGPAAGMTRRGHWASAGRRGRPDEASPRAGGRAR